MICAICNFNTTPRGMGSYVHKHNLLAKRYYDLYSTLE